MGSNPSVVFTGICHIIDFMIFINIIYFLLYKSALNRIKRCVIK